MPQGTQLSGEDGIIILKDPTDDSVIGEVPCLVQWTLDTTAEINERSTKCMKSNGDGGSALAGAWKRASVGDKSWSGSLTFYWQEDQLIPGSVKLDITNVGDKVKLELYPNDNADGKVVYTGEAFIESGSIAGDANGDDMQTTVQIKGDGELVTGVVTP